MRMATVSAGVTAFLAAALGACPAGAASDREPPYWASISAGQARMRTGPGRSFPTTWLYRRADLPVKVVQVIKADKDSKNEASWRKVQDPDGATGWMLVNLLSDQRTAIVTGGIREMHAKPDAASPIVWRAAPGVVGRLSHCGEGWCAFDVHGQKGYIETAGIWGVDPDEVID
jgi:SH3-like domain-containing protein